MTECDFQNIVVIGASGAIGEALLNQVATRYPLATVHAFSRKKSTPTAHNITWYQINYDDESSIEQAAQLSTTEKPIDLMLVATGILHENGLEPEKGLKALSADKFRRLFEVNTILPALIAKHFAPRLNKQQQSIMAFLSARVGSISDNRLGGWYSYRASKAALNMIIKNCAIEMSRTHKQAIILGLHPGTVDSHLSEPFQANVPENKLFSPDYAASQLLAVLLARSPADSGHCFAWDGEEVMP